MDTGNVTCFTRNIAEASVVPVSGEGFYQLCRYEVRGQSFLWHMVRYMMAVLYMVGDGAEEPEAAARLLDMSLYPQKPHFMMAPDAPLVLHDCLYDRLDFQWQPENLWRLQAHLEAQWEEATLRAARLMNAVNYLADTRVRRRDVHALLDRRLRTAIGSNNFHTKDGAKLAAAELERLARAGADDASAPAAAAAAAAVPAAVAAAAAAAAAAPAAAEETGAGAAAAASEMGEGAPEDSMTWGEALLRMRAVGFSPEQPVKKHVPLSERVLDKSYEERVAGMNAGTSKHGRLERHMALQQQLGEEGAKKFYQLKFAQGSVASDN
eukprot:TRINITY_DN4663_c0_g2_i3.p1 TRINITY_DN4663_c0_g2~~TRINITY_DN4663_c0_g2_i3.p1  ORF type:complete len:323 (-),score=144.61 TRINITY_DN4663_c0_g2_i3:82-1050(-)